MTLCCCFFYFCRQRDKLEDMLRDLTPERAKIAKSMVFCVNHADCAEEVIASPSFHFWSNLCFIDSFPYYRIISSDVAENVLSSNCLEKSTYLHRLSSVLLNHYLSWRRLCRLRWDTFSCCIIAQAQKWLIYCTKRNEWFYNNQFASLKSGSCSWDDTEVWALSSHQGGPGSVPRLKAMCGLTLLLVIFSAREVCEDWKLFYSNCLMSVSYLMISCICSQNEI